MQTVILRKETIKDNRSSVAGLANIKIMGQRCIIELIYN